MLRSPLAVALSLLALDVMAATPDFSGRWTIDLRTPTELASKADCGNAWFVLQQKGETITVARQRRDRRHMSRCSLSGRHVQIAFDKTWDSRPRHAGSDAESSPAN